ncbi:UNVERIFIED_CONTAM: adaptin n terminal region domain-containing protein [Hammondia hammondi]|eukprot:XP_008886237.1 adaptin n terminal region domain-containing protein [Hammondia hammondi]
MAPSIRGVSLFIQDVRNAPSSSREQARVLQELSKIRQRFAHPKKPLTGYEKKKCLTKLLYIHLLGYPVDIGHAEAISLLSSPHYSERSAAFLFCSLLLVDSHTAGRNLPELRSLCCSSIKKELSLQQEDFAALALDCASYISDPDAAAELFPLMQATANPSSSASPLIRQKAYSCMLVFFRLRPSLLPCEVWASRLGQALLFEQDLSCLLSLVSLIFHAVLRTSQLHRWQQQLQLSAINILARILSRDVPESLFYRGIPAPWLTVRLLQLLQCFQVSGGQRGGLSDDPSRREEKRRDREEDTREDEAVVTQQREAVALSLNEIVKTIFTQVATANEEEALPHQSRSSTLKGRKSHSFSAFRASSLSTRLASLSRLPQRQSSSGKGDRTGGSGDAAVPQRGTSFFSRKKGLGAHAVSPSVIQHAVLYEAISLSTHLQADADKDLKLSAAALLCSFVEEGDSNFRYKSLSLVAAMAADPDVQPELKGAVPAILRLLEEEDVSLRRQAISLLFALSGPDNWSEIVLSLLESLHRDAETLPNISAHIAVLVETYAPDPTWLVDVTFQMLQRAPQHVRDETWVHVIQVVSGSSSAEPSDARDGDKLSGKNENSSSVGRPDVDLQRYAASRAAEFLEDAFLNEPLLRLCAYLLGHFGHLIKTRVPGRRQIDALLFHFRRFVSASSFLSPGNFPPFTFIPLNDEAPAVSCCALLPLVLFALVKLAHAFPADAAPVRQVLQELHDSRDLELQARAIELSALLELPDRQFVAQTLAVLPPYRRRQLLSRPPPPRALAGPGGGRTTRVGANRAAEERLSAHLRAAPAATREAVAAAFSSSPRATGGSCEKRGRRGSSLSPQRESFERERSSSESSPSQESSDGNSESDRDSRDSRVSRVSRERGEESGEETRGRRSEDRRGVREERGRGRRLSDSSGAARSVEESAESEEERERESRGSSRSSSAEREEERRTQEKFMELLKSHPLPQSQNPEDQNRELWKRACIASEGTLCLLPGLLEVYVHRKFDKKDGMLLLEWRNLSRDKLLGLQRGRPQNSPEMLLKDEGFRPGEATWVEGSGTEVVNILPLQKAIQRIRLRCLQPFSAPPKLACLLFVSAGVNQPPQQIQLPLSLPVVMANFLVPAKAVNEGSLFLRFWKQLLSREEEREGERGAESKEKVLVGPLALPPHQVPLFLSAGFKFHVIKVGRNLCGSGTFHTGTPAAGASSGASPRFVCASSMCTVELNPNANPLLARITVRAAHPRVSLYLSRLLGFHLLRASAPASSSSLAQTSPEFALQSGSSPFAVPAGGESPVHPLSSGAGVVSALAGSRASVNLTTAQVAGGPPLFPSASAGSPTGLTPQNFYRMTN